MRTLVIHTAFIGDLILLTPLLDELRADPNTEWLGLLTTPACRDLFKDDPRLDEVILYDKKGRDRGLAGLSRMIRQLRNLQPDRVISPHRSLRSALLAWFSGAWERVGFSSATGSLCYTELKQDNRALHEVDRNLALIGRASPAEPRMPTLHRDPAEEATARALLDGLELVMPVALAPASVWATKRWLPSYFGELSEAILDRSPADVVLLGGPADVDLCNHIASHVHGCHKSRIHMLAGKLGLRESYQLLRLCSLAVVNDSAPLHLAQAAGIPTFAVFGSTVPEFGFGPRGERDHVLQVRLECVPCGRHGHRECPLGTLACMAELKPAMVLEKVLAELEISRRPDGRPD
jgi:heptosyltransferase-2